MKNIIITLLLVFSVLLSGCKPIKISYGKEAVLWHQPIFFGDARLEETPTEAGLIWVWLSTSALLVTVQPIRQNFDFKGLISNDRISLDINLDLRVQVTDSVFLVKNLGINWYDDNVHRSFDEIIRTTIKKYGISEVAGEVDTSGKFIDEIVMAMRHYVSNNNIPLNVLSISIEQITISNSY